jgi:hypothetical protein
MQTFLANTSSFKRTASELDNKRLNKQALEGWQILMNLLQLDPQGEYRAPHGWSNHPAVKMWRGSETALYQYIQQMVIEWKARGFNSTIGDKAKATMLRAQELNLVDITAVTSPAWMRDADTYNQLVSSHRVALLNKDYAWYSQFNWAEDSGVRPDHYQYLWPSESGELVLGTLNAA